MEHTKKQSTRISTGKLSELIESNEPNIVVLDVTIPMPEEQRDCYKEFKEGHIPGAKFLNLKECRENDTENAYMLPTQEKFRKFVESLGISRETRVVIYDSGLKEKGMFSSPRGWFMFRVFGHQEVCVLNGGLQRWIDEGKSVESGPSQPIERSNYPELGYNPELVYSLEDVKQSISDEKFQLIDSRPHGRYNGTSPELRPEIKSGHIPNSKSICWREFLENGVLKSSTKLDGVYHKAGVDLRTLHVATCSVGVTACFIALASAILGNPDVPVYDGSWMDWYLHAPNDLKVNVPKD